jgi:hypothetical protein
VTIVATADGRPIVPFADEPLVTIQCDICCPPWLGTNTPRGIADSYWMCTGNGDALDVCPVCRRRRPAEELVPRRDAGVPPLRDGGALPTFVVIGAAKAGTTSLHAYLSQHPDIGMSIVKEPQYFSDPDGAQWHDYYLSNFDETKSVRGEASTIYSRHPTVPGVPERMAAAVPDMKIIYMVRDPVDRAFASYVEEMSHDIERRPPEVAFADASHPFNPYVSASKYAMQLRRYIDAFPDLRWLVVDMNDLRSEPQPTLDRICAFLEVAPFQVTALQELNSRATKRRYPGVVRVLRASRVLRGMYRLPPGMREALLRPMRRALSRPMDALELPPTVRADIAAALADDVREFRELTGQQFPHWSI